MACKRLRDCLREENGACLIKICGCLESKDVRHIIVCKEKGMRYELINDLDVLIANYHVDNGIITDNDPKCDYLVKEFSDIDKFIFVELKGKDIIHALEQLKRAMDEIMPMVNDKATCYARIVALGNVPDMSSCSQRRELYKTITKFNKKFNGRMLKPEEAIISGKKVLQEKLSLLR